MQETSVLVCPVCKSKNHTFYISTNALMHKANKESYVFNKCDSCYSVFLTNKVSERHIENYYTNNYLPYKGSAAWGKFSSFVERSQAGVDEKRMQFVANETKGNNNFKILDIGCGNPSFLNLVHKKLKADCTGIDFSDKGWKNKRYKDLHLINTSLENFEPKENFDIITLWHYLEHDYHLIQTVEKLYNSLKTKGKLIIEVPDYNSLSAKIQKQYWQGWHSPRHLTLFSQEGFQSLFPKEKWTIKKHLRHGTLDAFTLWWLGKMEKKQINWSASMEKEFWPLVLLKIVTFPVFLLEKIIPLGIQLVVIEKSNDKKNNLIIKNIWNKLQLVLFSNLKVF